MSKHVFYVGDALAVLKTLPSESVHCVVTSPPYWSLRDYGVEGQIGLEETPEEYVERLVEVFREVRRVLRRDGVLWLNLADCYASDTKGSGGPTPKQLSNRGSFFPGVRFRIRDFGLKPKDLVGIPWMVAFALRDDGWWLRSDIIWAKPNPMPESVTDRPTKAHEYVFLLAKSERYFYDAEAIAEPSIHAGETRVTTPKGFARQALGAGLRPSGNAAVGSVVQIGLKRNKRSVWWIATEPFPEAHFATFPTALAEPCIKAGTSEYGCCPKCGAPWERVVEHKPASVKRVGGDANWCKQEYGRAGGFYGAESKTISWRPTCICGIEKAVPCTVLDPFGGSGTVSLVAKRLGRNSIYIDLNPDYCDMAIRRLEPEKQPLFDSCEVRREVIA